jgi:glycerol uptake facilitator-like aquaporin
MDTIVDVPTPEGAYASFVKRPLWKDAVSECIGTMLFVYISLAGVNQSILTNQGQLPIAICFTLGLSSGIVVAGKSGGHLNPAVSAITYLTTPEFGLTRLIAYIASQLLGGFVAGLLVLSVYYSWINNYENKDVIFAGAFGTLRASGNNLFSSVLDQMYGSALLMFAIIVIPDSKFKPMLIGLALGGLGLFQGTNGFGLNPARDMGPRLASSVVFGAMPFTAESNWFWVPTVVPFVGVALGALLAKLIKMLD